ncbi:hypothetical protein FIBSPDRAFT_861142 [Athelia psychrophila]|uniref:Uncharacterized protein n=1 Tax=Athelia psychrophila TaxID=1759441 RepID=A0A166JL70_9AGAM|nr:hypothetical protein FIBSPDRAFT_872117 [Fibularhizoctonia sp. CBS 109695]KZP20982.1 hypothetical protein FIBSPDRAFT_861142 [Fibularhizoctonia sp. CBS 109695]
MIVFGRPHLPLLAVDASAHCQCQKYVPSPGSSLCHHAARIPRTEKRLLGCSANAA